MTLHAIEQEREGVVKAFRRIATRNDKLRKTLFAVLHLVLAFLIVKNS